MHLLNYYNCASVPIPTYLLIYNTANNFEETLNKFSNCIKQNLCNIDLKFQWNAYIFKHNLYNIVLYHISQVFMTAVVNVGICVGTII